MSIEGLSSIEVPEGDDTTLEGVKDDAEKKKSTRKSPSDSISSAMNAATENMPPSRSMTSRGISAMQGFASEENPETSSTEKLDIPEE